MQIKVDKVLNMIHIIYRQQIADLTTQMRTLRRKLSKTTGQPFKDALGFEPQMQRLSVTTLPNNCHGNTYIYIAPLQINYQLAAQHIRKSDVTLCLFN